MWNDLLGCLDRCMDWSDGSCGVLDGKGLDLYSMMDENGMDVPKTSLSCIYVNFLVDKRHVQ